MNQRIYNYSIHLIARQDYSEFKLRQKLLSKPDNSKEEVDEVIAVLKEKSLINEQAYARLFIRKWLIKGESESKIRMRAKGENLEFSKEQFTSAIDELGLTTDENIEKLVAKKLRSKAIPKDFLERQKLKDKVLRYLISKGYDFSSAKQEIEKYIQNQS